MWDTFWRVVIFVALICALATCASCSMFGGTLSDKELIDAVSEAGCVLESIKRDDGEIQKIDCQSITRFIR